MANGSASRILTAMGAERLEGILNDQYGGSEREELEADKNRLVIGVPTYLARNGNAGVAYGKHQTPTNRDLGSQLCQ
jgi:hypothetical protein